MALKRMRAEGERTARGWTRWIYPVMRSYKMGCCDCGLVHEVQFRVVKPVGRKRQDGRWRSVPTRGFRVGIRARRAERYTARERARMRTEP